MEKICLECDGSGEIEVYTKEGDVDNVYFALTSCPNCTRGLVSVEAE